MRTSTYDSWRHRAHPCSNPLAWHIAESRDGLLLTSVDADMRTLSWMDRCARKDSWDLKGEILMMLVTAVREATATEQYVRVVLSAHLGAIRQDTAAMHL